MNEHKIHNGLIVIGEGTIGQVVVDVQGSQGQLFSITDSLVGDLFSVSDISGIPIFNVHSDGDVTITTLQEIVGTSMVVEENGVLAKTAFSKGDYVLIAGSEMSGNIGRTTHISGHLVGGYNNIGANALKTNPIYSIGTSYLPNDTTLNAHYGIGYAGAGATFLSHFTAATTNWGMYVSAGGNANIFLDGSNGNIYATNMMYIDNQVVWYQGNDGAGSGLDSDLLDGEHGSYYAKASDIISQTLTWDTTTMGLSISGANTVTINQFGSSSTASNVAVKAISNDSYIAGFEAYGGAQGTGYFYVGQSLTHGGGMIYHGDATPSLPYTVDTTYLFRRSVSVDYPVMWFTHGSDIVYFQSGTLYADTNQRIFTDGYHPNADKWTTARTITLSGDVTGSTSIDGSANVTITTTVSAIGTSKWTEGTGVLYPKTLTNKVGIGTTSPIAKLSVSNNGVEGIEFEPGLTTNSSRILFYNRSIPQYNEADFRASNFSFKIELVEALVIDADGNVGIGEAVPLYKLDVKGTGRFNDTLQIDNIPAMATTATTYLTQEAGEIQSRTVAELAGDIGFTGNYVARNDSEGGYSAGSAIDLNAVTGTRSFYSSTGGINRPPTSTGNGHIFSLGYTSAYQAQLYIAAVAEDKFYYRNQNNSVWGTWHQVASQSWVTSQIPDTSVYVLKAGDTMTGILTTPEVRGPKRTYTDSSDTDKVEVIYDELTECLEFNFI